MKSRPLTWKISKHQDRTLVIFEGSVDSSCELAPLATLSGNVTFDLAGIQFFTSDGVRLWINFIKQLTVDQLLWVRCSVAVVTQLNMIVGFGGRAKVQSFFAPYFCRATGEEEERLLTVEEVPDPYVPPTFPCQGGVLELDDIPARYFYFLLDGAKEAV